MIESWLHVRLHRRVEITVISYGLTRGMLPTRIDEALLVGIVLFHIYFSIDLSAYVWNFKVLNLNVLVLTFEMSSLRIIEIHFCLGVEP